MRQLVRSRATGRESSGQSSEPVRTTKRKLLAAGGGLITVGLTGCMEAVDFIGGAILKDVNVANGTESERSGSIAVVGPDDERRLSTSFTVAPRDSELSEDSRSTPTFADVFTGSGEYTVTVSLASESAIDGTTDGEETVTVEAPEEQHIVVGLGTAQDGSAIEVLVIEEISDLDEPFLGFTDQVGSG